MLRLEMIFQDDPNLDFEIWILDLDNLRLAICEFRFELQIGNYKHVFINAEGGQPLPYARFSDG